MQNPEIKRSHVGVRMSELAVYNNTAYLAGQVSADASLDILGQTRSVLKQVDDLLAEAGTDKSQILMCQLFLSDLSNFAAVNQVWESWVVPGNTPPRATIQAQLANPAWLIEVVVTAAVRAA
jgi:enamine deaminase RidA (YjgF/YER057c/UK114 family)